ncbi:MAG: class I SAM-dependent methyltransferase [Verrucomicrobiota bacterium]
MPSLKRHQRDWEDLGRLDPFWAILSEPERQFGRWELEEFFRTGEREIALLLEDAERLGIPKERKLALDFGCGAGRLTRALAKRFERCLGVDISEPMLARARELNAQFANAEFLQNFAPHLQAIGPREFDFIYTHLVFQHLPKASLVLGYIVEFLRLLKPQGLLVFQVPHAMPAWLRFQPRRLLYLGLRNVGWRSEFLYRRLRLDPMKMITVPESTVVQTVTANGGSILEIRRSTMPALFGTAIDNRFYFVTKTKAG